MDDPSTRASDGHSATGSTRSAPVPGGLRWRLGRRTFRRRASGPAREANARPQRGESSGREHQGAAVSLMPAAFLGHGSPMNALEKNRYTEAWRRFGASVAKPRAILVVSAHWYVNVTAVTAMARPQTIHDFYCLLYTSPSPRDRQKSRMP